MLTSNISQEEAAQAGARVPGPRTRRTEQPLAGQWPADVPSLGSRKAARRS
jgi:hypothetical protein